MSLQGSAMKWMDSSLRLIVASSLAVACSQSPRGHAQEAQPAGDGGFSLTVTPADLVFGAGRTANAEVRIDRTGGFTGAIAIAVGGLPEGVTIEPLTIPAEATDGALTFHQRAGLPAATAQVTATASAGSAGRAATFSFKLAYGSTVSVSIRPASIALNRSGTATVEVDLQRTGFDESVNISLAGLDAAGITADSLTIDAAGSSGALVLRASATAALGTTRGRVQATTGADGYVVATAPLEPEVFAPCGLHIDSFAAASDGVFVGESAQLTAVFTGDSAEIDGVGPVESGRPVATPP